MRETKAQKTQRTITIHQVLEKKYPDATTFLTHQNPFELLIAVILSAQCTDERVNKTTPALFQKFPTPNALATAPLDDVKDAIKSINFFNNKAKNIKKTAEIIEKEHKNKVPQTLEELIKLPGVGRKTANVVLSQAFDTPGITVDTHLKRLTNRLGFTKNQDPVKIEFDLMKIWPKDTWSDLSTTLILHGRSTCKAHKASCNTCELNDHCPKKGVKNA